jgi:protein O-mannosyl-transferase
MKRNPATQQAKKPADPVQPGIPWHKMLYVCLGLCVLTLVTYSNSFRSGFVLDNQFLILQDPRLVQANANSVDLILDHTYWWPKTESGLYRPITTLSYLLNYAVLGEADHPAGYHWFNFALHALNMLLLFALALRFVKKLWPSALIATVWAVHPVLTESVTNIIGRSDLLAGAAILSGFLFYLKSADATGWKKFAWLAGLMAVTAIGVFSKESAVAVLGIIVLYELTWWKGGEQIRRLALGCAAMAPPFAAMFYQRYVVLAGSQAPEFPFVDNPLVAAHFITARLTSLAVMARYIWLLICPWSLSCDYSYNAISLSNGGIRDWICWLIVAAVIVAILRQYNRNRIVFFFGAFAFVVFVPVSNLLFSTGTIMAERFLYLPAAGFAVCLVLLIYAACEKWRKPGLAPIALLIIIALFGVRTWFRNRDWYSDITLWTSAIHTVPDSFKGYKSLAYALYEADPTHRDINHIIDLIEKSMQILNPLPDSLNATEIYSNAGAYYIMQGDMALRKRPDGQTVVTQDSNLAYQRGLQVLLRGVSIDNAFVQGYDAKERARGKEDAEIPPNGYPALYENLAIVYSRLGQLPLAYQAELHSQMLSPDKINAYIVLANILTDEGDKAGAATSLIEGLLITGNRGVLPTLKSLYAGGVDSKGCAFSNGPSGETLNSSCEPVHNEICKASADLALIYRHDLRPDYAARIVKNAVNTYGCSAAAVE